MGFATDDVSVKCDADWPVESLSSVTGVFDVAKKLVDDDIRADLVQRNPVDCLYQRLSEPDRSTREIPQTGAGTSHPPCQ